MFLLNLSTTCLVPAGCHWFWYVPSLGKRVFSHCLRLRLRRRAALELPCEIAP